MNQPPKVFAVIPTFNEELELNLCLDSLFSQGVPNFNAIVVNAGDALSPELAAKCHEVRVDSQCFWTGCMQRGFDEAVALGGDIVVMSNSDIEFLPGTLPLLVDRVVLHPNDVACSPGYVRLADGRLRLQYSRDLLVPFLVHNYLKRDWVYREDAPQGTLQTDLAGGQGVALSTHYLPTVRMDPVNFPQYRGDHDFWLNMEHAGARMFTVAQAGIVNQRPLAAKVFGRGMSLKKLRWYTTSPYAPESVITQWKLRKLHMRMPAAFISFVIMCPGVWVYRILKAGFLRTKGLVSPAT